MDSSIRKMLWGAFAALTLLVILGLALTLTVLQIGRRQEYRIVHGSAPLIDAVNSMGLDITTMVSAARGYIAQQQSQFAQQYDDAVRDFAKSDKQATELTEEPRDLLVVGDLRRHYFEVRQLADKQFRLAHDGKIAEASDAMLELARVRRSAP